MAAGESQDVASPRAPAAAAAVLLRAEQRREQLLDALGGRRANLPLRYLRQHVHFTTPADDETRARKAVEGGTASMERLLARFDVAPALLAERLDLPLARVQGALERPRRAPLVMLDGEDARALRDDVAVRGRQTATRLLREADWGATTLRFYRPPGLNRPGAAQDLVTVLYNAGDGCHPARYPLDGIVFPKVEHPEEVDWVMDTLDALERSLELSPGRIRLALLIESGWAVAQLGALVRTAAPRLCALILGLADYSADLALPHIASDDPLADWARLEIVNAAGAVGAPAIDGMTLDYPVADPRLDAAANRERFLSRMRQVYQDAVHARELGMAGKWVGHPAQLFAALLAFEDVRSRDSVEDDVRRLEIYAAAVRDREQGATVIDGMMWDRATDRHARLRLRRAAAMGWLEPQRALALGVVEPHELAAVQAIWKQECL